jgi:hypothetical protein
MYNKFLIKKNEKFFRFDLKAMTVEDLYTISVDPQFACCFIVFKRDDYLERFLIIKPSSVDQFLIKMEKLIFNREESGVDSDSFNIFNAEYLDCYPI